MCEIQKLKASVEQILTAAAEEIFGVFKRSIAAIEEKLSDSPKHRKRKKRRPDHVHQTDVLIPPDQKGHSPHVDQEDPEPPHITEDQEEDQRMKLTLLSECPIPIKTLWRVKMEQQDSSPSLTQQDPEPPHTKEEEILWTNQEGERLQGLEEAHITRFPSTPLHAKSKYDEDKAQFSQLHQSQSEWNAEEPEDGDDWRGSEPDSIQTNDFPLSDAECQTTQHQSDDDNKTCLFSSALETQATVQSTKKTFRCSVCDRGFAHQSEVTHHMSFHTRERPFSCSVCNKCFAQKGNLKEHMLLHTGEKPLCCPYCNKGFAYQSNLINHMLVHTGEKPFSCSVCKKDFAQRGSLNRHMLVHTGERPFSCSVCNKGFTRKFEVKQHMLTHTGKKPSIH